MRRSISILVLLAFVLSCVMPPQGFAQTLSAMGLMPEPGTMVSLSASFTPAHLKGMVVDLNDPFKFDFIMLKGDEQLAPAEKQAEYTKLIKYFLASLAVPDADQWVNLSPYEKDRMIPEDFGKTEMGRDLLAQDYLLKQIASSLTHPDQDLGKKFWARVYEEAYNKFGTTDINPDTINKVWITPDKAVVYEKNNTVYVLEHHLKVMMEEDYVALKENSLQDSSRSVEENKMTKLSSQIMREVIIPAIETEVNEGKNFAPLRQIFSGMLLSAWYKIALKETILGKLYADKSKVDGVDQDPKNNQEIYAQYLSGVKKGVFNMIREDVDLLTNETIPRKYFSGGAFKPADYSQVTETVKSLDKAQAAEAARGIDNSEIVSAKVHSSDFSQRSSVADPGPVKWSREMERKLDDFIELNGASRKAWTPINPSRPIEYDLEDEVSIEFLEDAWGRKYRYGFEQDEAWLDAVRKRVSVVYAFGVGLRDTSDGQKERLLSYSVRRIKAFPRQGSEAWLALRVLMNNKVGLSRGTASYNSELDIFISNLEKSASSDEEQASVEKQLRFQLDVEGYVGHKTPEAKVRNMVISFMKDKDFQRMLVADLKTREGERRVWANAGDYAQGVEVRQRSFESQQAFFNRIVEELRKQGPGGIVIAPLRSRGLEGQVAVRRVVYDQVFDADGQVLADAMFKFWLIPTESADAVRDADVILQKGDDGLKLLLPIGKALQKKRQENPEAVLEDLKVTVSWGKAVGTVGYLVVFNEQDEERNDAVVRIKKAIGFEGAVGIEPTPLPHGGIDMNVSNLDMQIKRDGNGIVLPMNQQNLENIQINGLVPVILDIRPASTLPLLSAMVSSATSGSV